MKYNKNRLAMIILICVIIISACTQSYSQAPADGPTLIPTGLFVSPFPSAENPMAMIEEFAKGTATAAALTAAAGGASLNSTVITPQNITATPVTFTVTPITFTPTPGTPVVAAVCTAPACTGVGYQLTCPSGNCVGGCGYVCTFAQTPSTPASSGNIYYLKKDEFPYCIARRFDKNPAELLAASGLTSPDIYSVGQRLVIPAGGSWSPPPRDLRPHPDTYTVTGNGDASVYGVACKYGSVDPDAIAQLNGISASAALTIGQQIKVP